jgi:hypothetical protein
VAFLSTSTKQIRVATKSGNSHFLPYPFQSIIHWSSYVHLLYEPEYTVSCVGNLTEDETCVRMSNLHMNTRNFFKLASSTILVMTWHTSHSFP